MNLTPRQNQLLKAIVEEYITTAEPVPSDQIDKRYNLGVSPATIRNEMGELTHMGFLRQPHTSAGRVPTPLAMHFYIDHLMQEKRLSLADEVSVKEQIWDVRQDYDKLLRHASLALANQTKTLSLVTTNTGDIYYSGVAHILDMPEFFDIDVAKTVLSLLDEDQRLRQLFFGRSYDTGLIHILFGQELGWPYFEPVGMAFTYFTAGSQGQGTLAVVGPCRLNFSQVIPNLRYFSGLVSELTAGW